MQKIHKIVIFDLQPESAECGTRMCVFINWTPSVGCVWEPLGELTRGTGPSPLPHGPGCFLQPVGTPSTGTWRIGFAKTIKPTP